MFTKSKAKMASIVLSIIISLFTILTPILLAAGAVAVPIVAIHEIFTSIGDFVFGDGETNDVIEIINKYLDQEESKKMIKTKYQPLIDKEKDIELPLHWLVIPNLLAGIEDLQDKDIQLQINLIKKSENSLEKYINLLRKESPWNIGFNNISTTTIVSYINQFDSYLGQEGGIDVGDLKEHEFLYPLKKKAVVTSEFGQRWPVTLPNGQVIQEPHSGMDLAYGGGDAKTCGVPIYASMPGEVVATDKTVAQAGANWGSIKFKNLEIWYLHLRDPFPYTVGTKVKKGDFVGYIGSTGYSTACHLHFETHVNDKPVNPRNFLDF